MENNKRLPQRLYYISAVAFYLATAFAAIVLFFDIFTEPGAVSNFTTAPHHTSGYGIPVTIQLNTQDSLIAYKSRSSSGMLSIGKGSEEDHRQMAERILENPDFDKTLAVNSVDVYGEGIRRVDDKFNAVSFRTNASGYLTVNPKDTFLKLTLAVKNYLLMLVVLFVLWQVMAFFKNLKEEFLFNRILSKRLSIIGYALLCYMAFNLAASLIIGRHIDMAQMRMAVSSEPAFTTDVIKAYTETEFSLPLAFLGLSLVAISKLLNYGYELQQENELTI